MIQWHTDDNWQDPGAQAHDFFTLVIVMNISSIAHCESVVQFLVNAGSKKDSIVSFRGGGGGVQVGGV